MAIYTTSTEPSGRYDVFKTRAGEPQEDDTHKEPCEDTNASRDRSSEIELQNPLGRAHAGEVTRRTDRQATALPPPEPSTSSQRTTVPTTGRGRRRRAHGGGGGFNSDSDSDDDKKRNTPRGEDDPVSIRQPRRPVQPEKPSSPYAEVKAPYRAAPEDDDMETKKYRCMQETLKHLELEMTRFMFFQDQAGVETRLLREMPAGERPGAVGSVASDERLESVDNANKARFDHELAAFMTVNGATGDGVDEIKPYFEKMLQSGQVNYKYIQLEAVPDCALELCKLLDSPFWGPPEVFRVLVKDNMLMHAEPIDRHTLRQTGWKRGGRAYWWRY
ncbi:hypothetical protein BJY00DRAFT_307674 [Aspergillus carlsbadensis]|nr:hypothetical protein BJY00DRAFT_307674 [Aspergillus carlsbadensis]